MIETTQTIVETHKKRQPKTLTKDTVSNIKRLSTNEISEFFKWHNGSTSDLSFIFENLGQIPKTFDYDLFLPYLSHKNDNIRYWAVKNLGKSKSEIYLNSLIKSFYFEHSSVIKREIISSIGRMQTVAAIPFLIEALTESDPKIVVQAVRALLVFKGTDKVDCALRALEGHENEMIHSIILKEYFNTKKNPIKNTPNHVLTYNSLKNTVVNADVRDVLGIIPDECFHLTFTSPPYYNARDYSIYPSYDAYLSFLEQVFSEVFRLTKEGRYLIVNTSPVIIPRMSRSHSSKRYPIPFDLHSRLTKTGWEFIDDIIWMKPEYSVKNRIGGFLQHRKPLAYKPNSITEYLMVYRKKTDRLIDWNIKQYPENIVEESKVKEPFEKTNVWQIAPKSNKIHSAVFPEELCKRVIQYYSFKGDLVFDPFAGSGTMGRTAAAMGRNFFLTENNPTYFEYMKNTRTAQDTTKFLNLNDFKEVFINDIRK